MSFAGLDMHASAGVGFVFATSVSAPKVLEHYSARLIPQATPFFASVFHGFLELRVFRIDEVNVSQPSGVVELRLFHGPMLLFFSLRCFQHS